MILDAYRKEEDEIVDSSKEDDHDRGTVPKNSLQNNTE